MKQDTTNETIERVPLLEAQECMRIHNQVHELRSHWILRDGANFYSLGAVLYLDAPVPETVSQFKLEPPGKDTYRRHVEKYNPILERHFAPLYEHVAKALASALGAAVRYTSGLGLPGFHIYQHAPDYSRQATQVPHYDRQYECIEWGDHPDIDFTAAVSFTFAICLPADGGGLRIWDLDLFEVLALEHEAAKQLAKRAPWRIHDYVVGELVYHRGHLLHQIAKWKSVPGDERITLQGHGLFYDGCWNLYW